MASDHRLLRESFREISFFWWLLGVLISAPAIVSIVQSVFVNRPLIPPLQLAMDHYDAALDMLGRLTEPYLIPLVEGFGGLFGWEPTLHPYWRALFVFLLVPTFAGVLRSWLGRRYREAAEIIIVGSFLRLIPCLGGAMLPVDGPWWIQGLTAALPVVLILVSGAMTGEIIGLTRGKPRLYYMKHLFGGFGGAFFAVLTALFFVAGAALSFLPVLQSGGGLAALLGGFALFFGLSGFFVEAERGAFNHLGPFLGAGVIYTLDWAVRAAGWVG